MSDEQTKTASLLIFCQFVSNARKKMTMHRLRQIAYTITYIG